jgi:hypothetical protein
MKNQSKVNGRENTNTLYHIVMVDKDIMHL